MILFFKKKKKKLNKESTFNFNQIYNFLYHLNKIMFKVISKLNISHRYQKRNLTISYPFEATEFWKKNEQLIKKRKNDDLLFVFFEGVPGCGKHDVLNRLNKVRQNFIFISQSNYIYK